MGRSNKEKLLTRIDNHLRMTARHLIKFDTEEETLQFLIDSFRSELSCDLTCIIFKKDRDFFLKVMNGASESFVNHFPIKLDDCRPDFMEHAITFTNESNDVSCELSELLWKENIKTWFTVPVKDDGKVYGFFITGFRNDVPLYLELNSVFSDFGTDIAMALNLAQQREEQKKKITGMEWITNNLSVNSTLDRIIGKVVERAGKGTDAEKACIYLYSESENSFIFQSPSYGNSSFKKKIALHNNDKLIDCFPYLDIPDGNMLTVSLTVNLKTIGVIHIENKRSNQGKFTSDDLQVLEFLAQHVAALIENVRLFESEKNHKQRLQMLLNYQHALIKETIEQENFSGMTKTISELFIKSVLLFDRFMRPIAYSMMEEDKNEIETIIQYSTFQVFQQEQRDLWNTTLEMTKPSKKVEIWPINHSGDMFGYLVIYGIEESIDDFFRLSVDIVLNIYSLQFIKQKLVFDTKEQVKDSFIDKLLVESISNEKEIIQYANIFKWNLFLPHRVSVLAYKLEEQHEKNLLKLQEKKALITDRLRERVSFYDKEIMFASKGDEFILLVPTDKEKESPKKYWREFYSFLQKWSKSEEVQISFYLGVGGKSNTISEYYPCYQQAEQALNVFMNHYQSTGVALYDELGASTLLRHLKDITEAQLFIEKYLGKILENDDEKTVNLYQTLRAYLNNNGILKDTSEELFIHRSTLQYRLNKIESLLEIDLLDSEQRFNLLLAYKLNDLVNHAYSIKM
ncbi:helix-turn-helix domain-containing protein [Metabacillus sediminilitoris]|uniref:GAF domain-containing protein n=1 Tax=Metabacillus sediminilitoris TaxID=2567941 RepID=A0A4V3WFD5_9BACI|nr:helix-turn-helix domain-containing protein [Metabacillus sediminilitoris]QGQ46129.1 GAF domain-containing protein [Metabacillus sediminilitoris]THF79813.1 GAF domain-containing protein [Metabacillus sediminilitoris]